VAYVAVDCYSKLFTDFICCFTDMVGEITAECRQKLDAEVPAVAATDEVQRWSTSTSSKQGLPKPSAALNAAKVWGDSCDDPHAGDPIDDEDESCGTCGTSGEGACETDACGSDNCDCKTPAENEAAPATRSVPIPSAPQSGAKQTFKNLPNFDTAPSPVVSATAAATISSATLSPTLIFGALIAILVSLAIIELL
jgi:hypothetical protein